MGWLARFQIRNGRDEVWAECPIRFNNLPPCPLSALFQTCLLPAVAFVKNHSKSRRHSFTVILGHKYTSLRKQSYKMNLFSVTDELLISSHFLFQYCQNIRILNLYYKRSFSSVYILLADWVCYMCRGDRYQGPDVPLCFCSTV